MDSRRFCLEHLVFRQYETHIMIENSTQHVASLVRTQNMMIKNFITKIRFERSRLGRHNQGKSSSTPVTSDLSKTFHQICLASSVGKKPKRVQKTVFFGFLPTDEARGISGETSWINHLWLVCWNFFPDYVVPVRISQILSSYVPKCSLYKA